MGSTDWATPLRRWRDWRFGEPAQKLPYTLPGSLGDQASQWLGQLRAWWRDVFLLAAGYLAEKPGFAARQFLQQIARQGTSPEEQLTALALAGRGRLQLRPRLHQLSTNNASGLRCYSVVRGWVLAL